MKHWKMLFSANVQDRVIPPSWPPPASGTLTAPGKELTFVRAPASQLRFREDLGHDTAPVPPHRHLWQTERFTVIEGRLSLTVDGKTIELGEGESVDVPPKALHTYAPTVTDGSVGSVLIQVDMWPALHAGQFFETVYGLTREGGLPPRRFGDVLTLMALSHAHGFVIGGPPMSLMRIVAAAGAALATLLRIDHWSPRFAARTQASAPTPLIYLPGDIEADP